MSDYIRWLRERVGPDLIQLNFAAACILNQDRVLLQRRSDDGTWCFPGGAIDLDESAHDAVVREVREETGLIVRVDALQGVYTRYRHVYPHGDIVQPIAMFFRCTAVGGTLDDSDPETLELRYWPITDIPPLPSPQHRDALDDLRANRLGVYR